MKIIIIIIILLSGIICRSQNLFTYTSSNNKDIIGTYLYLIKIKHKNESTWFSIHNYLYVSNFSLQDKGYIDFKLSFRVKRKEIIYYNLYFRIYHESDLNHLQFGLLGQLRIKL